MGTCFAETVPDYGQIYIPEYFIRQDEIKNNIEFSNEGLITFVNKIQELEFKHLKDIDDILLEVANSESIFSDKKPIVHIKFSIAKKCFQLTPPIKVILKHTFQPDQIKKGDSALQTLKVYEELSGQTAVYHAIYKGNYSMGQREFINKHMIFCERGRCYHYMSSIPDKLNPSQEDIVRCLCYFRVMVFEKNDKSFDFDIYEQIDKKLTFNRTIESIPQRVKDFKENLIKQMNKIKRFE